MSELHPEGEQRTSAWYNAQADELERQARVATEAGDLSSARQLTAASIRMVVDATSARYDEFKTFKEWIDTSADINNLPVVEREE